MRIWPGTPYPLGATWDGWGTNFTLFSEVAESVQLCLFGEAGDGGVGGRAADGELTETRIELTEVDGFVWRARSRSASRLYRVRVCPEGRTIPDGH